MKLRAFYLILLVALCVSALSVGRLFSTLHRANCLAVLPEGTDQNPVPDGTLIDCLLLDVEEGTVL